MFQKSRAEISQKGVAGAQNAAQAKRQLVLLGGGLALQGSGARGVLKLGEPLGQNTGGKRE